MNQIQIIGQKDIYRLNDTTWAYTYNSEESTQLKEIHINIPSLKGKRAYEVANHVTSIFKEQQENILKR